MRRSIVQDRAVIVPVPMDGLSFKDWNVSAKEIRSAPFLAKVN